MSLARFVISLKKKTLNVVAQSQHLYNIMPLSIYLSDMYVPFVCCMSSRKKEFIMTGWFNSIQAIK